MGVTLSGGSGFEHFLDAKINVGTEVIEVIKRNGAQMQQRAQSLAPVDTGFLKRDITLSFTNAGVEFAAAISGDAEYDPYQEYGTRFMAGKPHIRPAYYYQRVQFTKDIRELVLRK